MNDEYYQSQYSAAKWIRKDRPPDEAGPECGGIICGQTETDTNRRERLSTALDLAAQGRRGDSQHG